jgi:4'-phosphopantetheinyl transferase EntD
VAAVLSEVLPAYVVTEHRLSDADQPRLLPEEEALVAQAVDKRRQEFATTRACAHAALTRLGAPPGPLLSGGRGQPLWPTGFVGSLTHCDGFRGAAVARRQDVRALGVDAEPNGALPDGVLRLVARDEERRAMQRLPMTSGVHWDRLLFSAKEAVFKAWFPVAGRELSFEDVTLTVDPLRGTFDARFLVDNTPLGAVLSGKWLCRNGFVVTGVCVTAG